MGNRWLSCALLYYHQDLQRQHSLLYCFMDYMTRRGDPWIGMDGCLDSLQAPPLAKAAIDACGRGDQGTELQKQDEVETTRILPSRMKHFVPFISINGKGHLHMQAYQLIMADKLRAWNSTLSTPTNRQQQRVPPQDVNTSSHYSTCHSPPDFWCSDIAITTECFSLKGCSDYLKGVYGKPVEFQILYNPQLPSSRSYLLQYIKPHFLTNPSPLYTSTSLAEIDGKYSVELAPVPTPNGTQAVEECIYSSINEVGRRNIMLLCLLEARNDNRPDMRQAWIAGCAPDAETSRRIL